MKPSQDLLERAERLLGSRAVGWRPATGGYSIAERWTLELADGRRAFTKLATTDDIARRLREEYVNMSALDADFRCDVIAWEDTDRPLLVLEDLSDARWPPPWEPGDVERVLATLERMWSTPPPSHVPSGKSYREVFTGWEQIRGDPQQFLALGLCSPEWLAGCVPPLIQAEQSIALDGHDLVHLDVRSDNLCFAGDRVVFVDWNFASRGDRRLDLAYWLPSLRLEGGPLPDEVAPGLGAHAAALSGFFGLNAGAPPPEGAPTVRRFQLRQLRIALPWACRELGLPQPDGDWATVEIDAANRDLEAATINEATWHARIEEPLSDVYLMHAEPWRQSGKSGDETDWRWSRELVLDVAADGDAVLDVGCANGYLMESLHRWAAERGLRVEPYGVDISWRLASLARRRLPHWADRIFVGNVVTWTPPRRFDIVHTALDYMPADRGGQHVARVLREFLVPGGRLVLRAVRMPWTPDPVEELESFGFRPDGVLEALHPTTGEVRRTAYLRAPVG